MLLEENIEDVAAYVAGLEGGRASVMAARRKEAGERTVPVANILGDMANEKVNDKILVFEISCKDFNLDDSWTEGPFGCRLNIENSVT